MKKVFAAILVAVLVAAIPATASAAGSSNCKSGVLIPCHTMPPSGANSGKGTSGSGFGTTRGGSGSSLGVNRGGSSTGASGSHALPPTGIR